MVYINIFKKSRTHRRLFYVQFIQMFILRIFISIKQMKFINNKDRIVTSYVTQRAANDWVERSILSVWAEKSCTRFGNVYHKIIIIIVYLSENVYLYNTFHVIIIMRKCNLITAQNPPKHENLYFNFIHNWNSKLHSKFFKLHYYS